MALGLALAPTLAGAQDPPEPSPIEQHRTKFDALTERTIGRASKRVRYDWRRGTVQVAATLGLPAELNNFESLRTGLLARVPTGGVLLEFGASWVFVTGNKSTHDLARTPYRQPGRPARLELDFGVAVPLAEGVVTPINRFIPAAELTFNGHAQLRYLFYPGGFAGLGWKDTLAAVFSGSLSGDEKANLEDDRLGGMEIDPGRYVGLLGVSTDLYFQSGFFVSNKFLLATPMLSFMTDTKLTFGFEWDLALGVAF